MNNNIGLQNNTLQYKIIISWDSRIVNKYSSRLVFIRLVYLVYLADLHSGLV